MDKIWKLKYPTKIGNHLFEKETLISILAKDEVNEKLGTDYEYKDTAYMVAVSFPNSEKVVFLHKDQII